MKCEDCGNNNGIKTICPYAKDVHDEIIEVILCDACVEERAMDI